MINKTNKTLERLHTDFKGEVTSEHLHRYAVALELSENKIVLDIACGEGYGSNILSEVALKVIGVDIDANTIENAVFKYKKSNLIYKQGSTSNIPLENNSVDVVVSFETIEHHDEHLQMLSEIKRVLRKDGLLIISTPEKLNYSDKRNYKNEFHVKELYKEEFENLLKNNFANIKTYFQKMAYSSIIFNTDESTQCTEYSGDFSRINTNYDISFIYLLAIASNAELPKLRNSHFIHSLDETLADLVGRIQNSNSYKIGDFLLTPIRILKNIFKK